MRKLAKPFLLAVTLLLWLPLCAGTSRALECTPERQAEYERLRQACECLAAEEIEPATEYDEEKAIQYAGEMIPIPGGTFLMGDLSGEGNDSQKPVHSVTVPAFRMGKYEVTFA